MKNLSIIDGNSLGYAAHYGTKLTAGDKETQAVFGVARSLIEMKTKHPETKPIVLWDGRAEWRFEKCPTYKSNRHSDDPKKEAVKEAYKTQVPYIKRILKAMGVSQVMCHTHEADDLAGLLVKKKKPEDFITLVTGDKDWLQLVRHNVIWFDVRKKEVVSTQNFFNYTHYKSPEAFLDGKCLHGDTSDAIPGVGRIGEKGAIEFLATYGSVQNFFNGVDSGVIVPTKKAHKDFAQSGRDAYYRNFEVMQLLNPKPIDVKNIVSNDSTSKNREEFLDVCAELAFASLMRDADNILSLF